MEQKEFKPYIPADKIMPEFNAVSVILGSLLALVFGMANAYLGLKVGLTISASIPAAVISMGIVRGVMKRKSILENNMVQTIGSAGESMAAGCIFTMPALFLWSREGLIEMPGLLTLSIIAICGGVLGCAFMIPMRNALIVKEHATIPYPEGTACAEVLLAGEKGGTSARKVFIGMGIGAAVKFIIDGLCVVPSVITAKIDALKTQISAEPYPALLGVGYICGPQISSKMISGGILAWFVLIPLICVFGGNTVMFPAEVDIATLYAEGGASAIWSNFIKYIGAGAIATAGIISLFKSLPMIVKTFSDAVKGMKNGSGAADVRTEKDLNMNFIILAVILCGCALLFIPSVPMNLIGVLMVLILGFVFAVVSARIAGIVGSSNSPSSGMTIAVILIATPILKLTGTDGSEGMLIAITIASVICIITAMAGDMSQDLKTGYIVGATPVKQQIGELIGTAVTAFAIGGIMLLLDSAWGFGTQELAAPQAVLMKTLIEGIMNGNLPWGLIFVGAAFAVILEILGIPGLTVCIGVYLPLELTTTIMIGGIIRWIVDKKCRDSSDTSDGILFSSGLIAGEGLIGVLLAVFAVCNINTDISKIISLGAVGAIVILVAMAVLIGKIGFGKSEKQQ